MNTLDLKEYLEIIVNMEKNIYLQNNLISQMESQFTQLGQTHTFEEPIAPKDTSIGGIFAAIWGGLFALIGILLLHWGLQLCDKGLGNFLLGVIVLLFGVCFLLSGIISAIYMLVESSKDAEFYQAEKDRYDTAYAEYEKNIRADKERVRKELIKKAILASELQCLQKQNKDSKQNLEQIYSKDIIFPKYRNLIMVCSIYEYICAGRCTTLEGHEGAYNILEMEIRLDRIITQLDQVIARLDVIRSNQYMLYSAIQETNQTATQILKSTQYMMDSLQNFHGQTEELRASIVSMQEDSALAAYQAQSIQQELHYMNRMNYLSGKYNNVFNNLPPT